MQKTRSVSLHFIIATKDVTGILTVYFLRRLLYLFIEINFEYVIPGSPEGNRGTLAYAVVCLAIDFSRPKNFVNSINSPPKLSNKCENTRYSNGNQAVCDMNVYLLLLFILTEKCHMS